MVFKLNILFVMLHFVLSDINNGFFLLIFMFSIMAFIIILRFRKAIRGTKVDVKKTIIFSVYFIAVAFFFIYTSFLIGIVPFVYFVPYFAVAVTAVYCSYSYSKRAVSFWELPTGNDAGNSIITYAK
jgi:hypothetical protein